MNSFSSELKLAIERTHKSFWKLVAVSIMSMLFWITIGMVGVIAAVISLNIPLIKPENGDYATEFFKALPMFFTEKLPILTFWIVIAIVISSIVMSVIQLLVIKILAQKETSFGVTVGHALALIIPMSLLNLLNFVLVFGMLPFLIIPALIVSILLSFGSYELIFKSKNPFTAIKRSVLLISSHFGDLLIRYFGIVVIYILVGIILSAFKKALPDTTMIVQFIQSILQALGNWYVLAFGLVLYQEVDEATTAKPKTPWWIYLLSMCGWIIIVGVTTIIIQTVNWNSIKDAALTRIKHGYQAAITSPPMVIDRKVPSICGISMPLPTTTDVYESEQREWLFNEIQLRPEDFFILDIDTFTRKVVTMSRVFYRSTEAKTKLKLSTPGIEISCIDNVKKMNLEMYASLATANKNLTITTKKQIDFNNIPTIPYSYQINEEKGSGFLAVSQDGSQLINLMIYGVDEADPMRATLSAELTAISQGLEYLEEE